MKTPGSSNLPIKLSIFLNYMVFAVLLNSVGIVILQVQNQYGVSPSEAKFLEGFKDLTIAVVSFFVGLLVLRVGYKRSMQWAILLVTMICFAMPLVPSFWMSKLLFAVVGFSFAIVKVTALSTIGLITTGKEEHLSYMSYLEALFMVGLFGGYLLFGEFVKDVDPDHTWLKAYYIVGAISLGALILLTLSPLDESQVDRSEKSSILHDLMNMLLLGIKPLALIFIVSIFMYVLIEQGIQSWLPTFNNKILDLPSDTSIRLAAIMPLAIALGRFMGGYLLKRIEWIYVLVICVILSAVLLLISLPMAGTDYSMRLGTWLDVPMAGLIFPLIGLWLAPIYPALNSLILSSLPLKDHAPMTALIVVFSALGGTTGSALMGWLFEEMEGANVFYIILIPMVLLLIAMILFRRSSPTSTIKSAAQN